MRIIATAGSDIYDHEIIFVIIIIIIIMDY